MTCYIKKKSTLQHLKLGILKFGKLVVPMSWTRQTCRIKHFSFTNFLAKMVFREFSFFIRIDNYCLFLKKIVWNMLCLLYQTLPKQLATKKCFQKKTKDWFEKISKTANFLSFYKRNQTTIVNSFYPKSPWNGLFADSLGKFWLISALNFPGTTGRFIEDTEDKIAKMLKHFQDQIHNKFNSYAFGFFGCELLNTCFSILSVYLTHKFLLNQYLEYGVQVYKYVGF